MNPNDVIKIRLRGLERDHPGKTLRNLSRIGPQVVKADHFVVVLPHDELHVASVFRPVCQCPLKRREVSVEDGDVVTAVLQRGVLFGKPAAAVLQRREDRRWDVVVVGQKVGFAADAMGQ